MSPINNIVMIKRARQKQVTLPDRRIFVAQYRRAKKSDLPQNVILRIMYKERATPKKKRRARRVRGIVLKIRKGIIKKSI